MTRSYKILHWALAAVISITAFAPTAEAKLYNGVNVCEEVVRLYKAGDYMKALQWAELKLKLDTDHYGTPHYKVAIALNNLGELYRIQGQYTQAEQYHLRSLRMRETLHGKKHAQYANALNNLGELYYSRGEWEKSEVHFMQALDIYRSKMADHPDRYQAIAHNLTLLYDFSGFYERARTLQLKVAAEYAKALMPGLNPAKNTHKYLWNIFIALKEAFIYNYLHHKQQKEIAKNIQFNIQYAIEPKLPTFKTPVHPLPGQHTAHFQF